MGETLLLLSCGAAFITGIVELFPVPYTGSTPQTLLVARSKPLTKMLLSSAGIPTAPYFVVNGEWSGTNPLGWPVIVKQLRLG